MFPVRMNVVFLDGSSGIWGSKQKANTEQKIRTMAFLLVETTTIAFDKYLLMSSESLRRYMQQV